mgnify:CR=1 FL=1
MLEVAEAKILFGSTEETKEVQEERKSPFDGAVVSSAPVCNADDTIRALKIAKTASKTAARFVHPWVDHPKERLY